MTHSTPLRRRRLTSARVRALLSLGIVFGLGSVGTMAAWSDTSTATTGTFTTGFIDLKLDGADNAPAAFTTAMTAAAMVPGTTVRTSLTVQNQGTVAFNYDVQARASAAPIGLLLRVALSTGSCPGSEFASKTGLTTTDQQVSASRGPVPAKVGSTPGTEALCVAVSIPSTAALPTTPVSGTVTFTFTATST
ncbi:MAG: TasA family protein [Rhodococcus sp. (in: high G+C Gram-positive bacteria)]